MSLFPPPISLQDIYHYCLANCNSPFTLDEEQLNKWLLAEYKAGHVPDEVMEEYLAITQGEVFASLEEALCEETDVNED